MNEETNLLVLIRVEQYVPEDVLDREVYIILGSAWFCVRTRATAATSDYMLPGGDRNMTNPNFEYVSLQSSCWQ